MTGAEYHGAGGPGQILNPRLPRGKTELIYLSDFSVKKTQHSTVVYGNEDDENPVCDHADDGNTGGGIDITAAVFR